MADSTQINIKLTPGEILIVAGGLVAFIFSFFDYYTSPFNGGGGISAWGKGLLPTATLIVFFCVIMAVQVVLTKLFNLDLGSGLVGFTWPQIHVALGFFALLDAFAFLLVSRSGLGIGVGLIFALIGSAACFVGAILLTKERAGAST